MVTYPDVKVEVLVFYRLDVEAYRGYRRDNLADLPCVSATPPSLLRGKRTLSLYRSVVFPALS